MSCSFEKADVASPIFCAWTRLESLAQRHVFGRVGLSSSSFKILALIARKRSITPSDILAELDFDAYHSIEPALGNQNMSTVARRLCPRHAIWGGVSGPIHIGEGTPEIQLRIIARTSSFTAAALGGGITEIGRRLGVTHVLEVRERLARGEFVGILADRAWRSGPTVRVPFLGRERAFPAGPYQLAAALKCPIQLMFMVKTGSRDYRLIIEDFASPDELPATSTPSRQSRADILGGLDARVASLNALADGIYARWARGLAH